MLPTISVIVPAYNAAKHIARALASLAGQTYANLEIIFVNDASADDTLDIGAAILKQSGANYKIIDLQKNSGVSAARNAGMNVASGEFITFLDADDYYFGADLVDALYSSAAETLPAADVTLSGDYIFDTFTGEKTKNEINRNITSELVPESIAKMRILNKIHTAHSTLYKAHFLRDHKITFAAGCSAGEDVEFRLKALAVSKKTAICHKIGYAYSVHGDMGSMITAPVVKIKRYCDHTEAIMRTADFIAEQSASPMLRDMARHLLMPMVRLRRMSHLAMTEDKAEFDQALREVNFHQLLQSSKYLSEKPEVFFRALFLYAFPGFYYRHYAKRYKELA